MAKNIDKLNAALAEKKLPVATLDNKWHKLFTKVEKTEDIKKAEKELNDVLRKQGKINSEIKAVKKIKKNLMDEIVSLMEEADKQDKVDENKRLIDECNEKIDSFNEQLMEMPKEIAVANKRLMALTMDSCYDDLHENEKGIEELSEWLAKIRVELKKNVVRKQELEIANQEIYSYMHDIFGAEAINLFDMTYNPSDNPIKKE